MIKSISGLLIFVLIANLVIFGVLMSPREAKAQMAVYDPANFQMAVQQYWLEALRDTKQTASEVKTGLWEVWNQFKSPWGIIAEITKAMFLVLMHQMLAKITNDIVAWINGGGKGKFSNQVRVLQDPNKFLQDSLDEAGGIIMGAILNVDPKTLCDASFLKLKLAPALVGPYAVPTFSEKVACTFSGMQEGLRKFREDFRSGGWRAFIEYTRAPNNQIGQTITVTQELAKIQAQRSAAAVAEMNIGKGFLAMKRCAVTRAPKNMPGIAGKLLEDAYNMATSQLAIASNVGLDVPGTTHQIENIQMGTSYETAAFSNVDDFRGWVIANGGAVDCKIVTPSEQISSLATKALEAPIKNLEMGINALTEGLGTGAGSVLKPYVLAIGNATLNLLLNKEKGLISDLFAPPKKDRKQQPRPSDSLQQNIMNASSAGQIAASGNDFRGFVLKSLVDFSAFVSNAAQIMDESNELGRLPLNRLEYARAFNKWGSGNKVTDDFLNANVTDNYDDSNNKPLGRLEGWLTNVDNTQCHTDAHGTNTVDFNATSTIYIKTASCDADYNPGDPNSNPNITNKMITTYPAGKILFEEAQWCGAYSQETPVKTKTTETPILPPFPAWNPLAIDYPSTVTLYVYNDDDDQENVIDRAKRVATSTNFAETLVFPHSDVNHDNYYDLGATTTAEGINDLFAMRPLFTDAKIDADGNTAGTFSAGVLAQAAAANGYVFGGYNDGGFSSGIYNINGKFAANLPIPLAGAEAVYYPPENRIYIFGGRNNDGYSSAIYEFDINTLSIKTMSALLPRPAYGMTGIYDPQNQRIYLFGGKTGENRVVNDITITEAEVSSQILEFNQKTDTIISKTNKLPRPIAHASAVPLIDGDGKRKIFIFGGMDNFGQAVGSIFAYDPLDSSGNGSVRQKSRAIQPRGHLAALPVSNANITTTAYANSKARIFGGEDIMGRWDMIQEYDAAGDVIVNRPPLSNPLSQTARSLENNVLVGGIINAPDGTLAARIFPQGDVYYIPGNAEAISKKQPVLQKFFSPTYEDASVSLLNIREDRVYYDPTLTVINPLIMSDLHGNGDEVYLPKDAFYPELSEKIQEFSEKLRTLKGYHYQEPNRKDYEAGIAQQVGSVPDDDLYDDNPHNPLYPDRPTGDNETNCRLPNEWDENARQCLRKGYRGSVSDTATKYKNLAEIYQALYSGATDERTLEGIDPEMTILSPEETNLKLALIGQRCPVLPPSATSTPEISEGCPAFGGPNGEYNMAKRFMFEADDTRQNPTGLTTGFATNPFNNKKSSSLAGILNLEEMAAQLQAAPPDKNIIKLIRLRQILEQLQVWSSATVAPGENPKNIRSFRITDSSATSTPDALAGVDTIQVSLFGFEKIQDWLNSTSTVDTVTGLTVPDKNKNIQGLIEVYGYTNAKEAYPEISKDLDTVLQDAVNQVTDKVREVFVKRTEKEMEQARLDAEYRLKRFIEYARDLNPTLKLSLSGDSARRLSGLIDQVNNRIDDDLYVLRVEPFTSSPNDPHWVNNIISGKMVDNNERSGLVGAAVYKIISLAKFIGMDTNSVEFAAMLTQYRQGTGQTPEKIEADLNKRLSESAADIYLFYRGASDQTNPSLSVNEKARTAGRCGFDQDARAYYCDLSARGADGRPVRIYKDATMKMKDLENNFELMAEEFSKIKEEFTTAINEMQSQKQGFEDLSTGFNELAGAFKEANACAGMPNIRWKPPAYVDSLYQALGESAALALAALSTAGIATLFGSTAIGLGATWGIISGIASTGWGIPLAIGIAVVAGIFNYYSSKKKKKEYEKKVKKAVNECKAGVREYNRRLGQIADNFICGRTNRMYEE